MKIYYEKNVLQLENLFNTDYENEMRIWRNQEFVRNNMRNQELISEEQHKIYLDSLKTGEREVFVFSFNRIPEAIINIDYNHPCKKIDLGMYLIDEKELNSGMGVLAMYMRYCYVFNKYPEYLCCMQVLEHNTKTVQLHRNLGERECGQEIVYLDGKNKEIQLLFEMDLEIWGKTKVKLEKIMKTLMR